VTQVIVENNPAFIGRRVNRTDVVVAADEGDCVRAVDEYLSGECVPEEQDIAARKGVRAGLKFDRRPVGAHKQRAGCVADYVCVEKPDIRIGITHGIDVEVAVSTAVEVVEADERLVGVVARGDAGRRRLTVEALAGGAVITVLKRAADCALPVSVIAVVGQTLDCSVLSVCSVVESHYHAFGDQPGVDRCGLYPELIASLIDG